MTEAEFQKQVVDLARELGWRVVHIPNRAFRGWPMYDAKGFPDLALFRPKPNRAGYSQMFWELKRNEKEKRTPEEVSWEPYLWPRYALVSPESWDWIIQELA